MTTKTMKYPPATYLEVDDGAGGRKVVLVGRDGVTFWDAVDPNQVTPLIIHPVLHPVELGSLASYVRSKGLQATVNKTMEVLRVFKSMRLSDSLYIMRVLWCLASAAKDDNWVPEEGQVRQAFSEAERQETLACRMHQYIGEVSAKLTAQTD